MQAIVVGTGTIGSAIRQTLEEHGHEVISLGRGSGDVQADFRDATGLRALFGRLAPFDAVASAAGDVFPGLLQGTTDEQWDESIRSKGMGQINLVRAALPSIADGGSFVLVSGVLGEEIGHHGTIGATVNGLVEGFVKAAEIRRVISTWRWRSRRRETGRDSRAATSTIAPNFWIASTRMA